MDLSNNDNDDEELLMKEVFETALLKTNQEDFFNWIEKTYVHGMSFGLLNDDGWWFTMATGALLPLRVSKDTFEISIGGSRIRFTVIPTSRGDNIVRIDATCRTTLPEFERAFRDVWSEILRQFKPYEENISQKQPAPIDANTVEVNLSSKPEKPKQKGRYRLTVDEIEFRQQKVEEAEKIKKENPQKLWKEIDLAMANELGISDRTFRAWRHNNY